MRIAYVVGWEGGPDTGPFKKIVEQSGIWRELGHEVAVFVLTTPQHASDWADVPTVAKVVERGNHALSLAQRKEQLVTDVLRWSPDVAYHRWSLPYPGLLRLSRELPLILEINGDDVAEYDLLSSFKGRFNRITRGQVLARAAGLVFVSNELSNSPRFARFQRPATVIANGIDLSRHAPVAAEAPENPTLLFVGQPNTPWHGLDKIVRLAQLRPTWNFDLIGPDAAESRDSPANLRFHGRLRAESYRDLYRSAYVGLGSLAMYRANLREGSPLKVREYLAHGLPVIIGYRDTDFYQGGSPYILQLPGSPTNVEDNLAEIDAFVARARGKRVPREEIRHIDVRVKETSRLEFFERVIDSCDATRRLRIAKPAGRK